MARILVVDDEESMRRFLSILLEKDGHQVAVASGGEEALGRIQAESFDVLVTDLKMPGMSGLELLAKVREAEPALPVIVLTAFASDASAIEAMDRGAFQFVEKKAKNDEICLVVKNALSMRRLQSENQVLKRQLKSRHEDRKIIGNSEEMHKVFKMVDRVAATDATILVYGESGTGKELIAREIHYRSHRAGGPFVSINCGALPKELLESNLFGHMRGSFTGAIKDQAGLFTVSENGTFFLDEVGEMAPATQVKLLRALQEREIIPVGGTKPIKINVRLIAATNADLEKEVSEGRFRTDLFYRLNVIPISLPPLRARRDDIPLLVDHFLSRFAPGEGKRITREALDALCRYDWPGNVRELENVIERAVIMNEGGPVQNSDLGEKVVQGPNRKGRLVIDTPCLTLEELEREYIVKVLQYTAWQKKRASEILGINPSTLYRKLIAYGMAERAAAEEGFNGGEEEESAERAA
ncbi:MAG: sigma-54-dependent Fis family transcriptional regulator [Candidatus Eisenbacteria bacterium]|nr:sigma-54-dependent Fis family transcriptional regulator [Candidatus Eisenbacteria bacterium]MCC7141699.1 sigma-54-dependent Fis family transcriptional regulator [Candidatus Eisenbacteria bacterium]